MEKHCKIETSKIVKSKCDNKKDIIEVFPRCHHLQETLKCLEGTVLERDTIIKLMPGNHTGKVRKIGKDEYDVQPINIQNIASSYPAQLTFKGDTRDFVGQTYLHGIPDPDENTAKIILHRKSVELCLLDDKMENILDLTTFGIQKHDIIMLCAQDVYEEVEICCVDANTIYLRKSLPDKILKFSQGIGLYLTFLPNVRISLTNKDLGDIMLNTDMFIRSSCRFEGVYIDLKYIQGCLDIQRADVEGENLVVGTSDTGVTPGIDISKFSTLTLTEGNNCMLNIANINVTKSSFTLKNGSMITHIGAFIVNIPFAEQSNIDIENCKILTYGTGGALGSTLTAGESIFYTNNSVYLPGRGFHSLHYLSRNAYGFFKNNNMYNLGEFDIVPNKCPSVSRCSYYNAKVENEQFLAPNLVTDFVLPDTIIIGVPFNASVTATNNLPIPVTYLCLVFFRITYTDSEGKSQNKTIDLSGEPVLAQPGQTVTPTIDNIIINQENITSMDGLVGTNLNADRKYDDVDINVIYP